MMSDLNRQHDAVEKILKKALGKEMEIPYSWSLAIGSHRLHLYYNEGDSVSLCGEVNALQEAFSPKDIKFCADDDGDLYMTLAEVTWPWER